MAREANAEKIKNLALEPVCTWPDRDQRVHDSVRSSQANFQANFVAPGNRNEVVIQFEPRFVRESVDASGICQQVKLQIRVVTTALGHGSQDFARENEGGLAPKFNHLFDCVGIPDTQVLDDKLRAIRSYRSQCEAVPFDHAFRGLARYRGEMHSWPGGPYAEAFAVLSVT